MKKFTLTFLIVLFVFGLGATILICFKDRITSEIGSTVSQGKPQSSASNITPGPDSGASDNSAENIPDGWNDNGIFSKYYTKAYSKLSTMTLEQKIGQMILARCPSQSAATSIKKYHLGGYILFEQDFKNKTAEQVISTIKLYQSTSDIPMLTAVDEEGGTVVRISSNPKLSIKKFQSPQQVYAHGGLSAIRSDTLNKAALLNKLGLNLNLAPDSDVSLNPRDYIYSRAFGQPAAATGKYVATVVDAMQESGLSSTLKHFPGYGNNKNTHTGIAIDNRPYSSFANSDFIPFEDGINAGAESILVAHTIVNCMEKDVPASLSPVVHQILRNELNFTGIIMTDDLSMDAIKDYRLAYFCSSCVNVANDLCKSSSTSSDSSPDCSILRYFVKREFM